VSTTTVGDLLDRAEILARSLRATDTQISTTQWHSFDATAYRLLHEPVGPERVSVREQILPHASMSRILNGYPRPLAAPNPQTTYNARQAANHLGVSSSTVVADIRGSRLPATFDGRRYSIKATDLPTAADVQPANPASTDPLDQLTCTLGVLADMVVAERSRTAPTPGFDPLRDDAQVPAIGKPPRLCYPRAIRVLSEDTSLAICVHEGAPRNAKSSQVRASLGRSAQVSPPPALRR
jgi:excisionase family DNA binding protein